MTSTGMLERVNLGRVCVRCVMNESAPRLDLDASGVCRYCREFDAQAAREHASGQYDEGPTLVDRIKRAGKGRRYDCVIGLSGGVDSSYALLLAKQLGLRPLAVHVDNGWNSELAVMNIENLVRKLEIDLHTIVIKWNEFRELQLAFLRAGVVDLELPSDHAILAGMAQTARQFRSKYVLTGDNNATEVTLPEGWNHRKTDLTNLKAIHRRFTRESLDSYPQLSTLGLLINQRLFRTEWVPLLSYFPYVKKTAIAVLQSTLGWRPYPGKHGESVITRFYQGFILPRKFGFDKRRIHLSRTILSGQMTRDEALAELAAPAYSPELQALDREFVIKKFRITEAEFERLMSEPPHPHRDYASDEVLLQTLIKGKAMLRGLVRRTATPTRA
jgi:N-acetyl sugar amidotransferase